MIPLKKRKKAEMTVQSCRRRRAVKITAIIFAIALIFFWYFGGKKEIKTVSKQDIITTTLKSAISSVYYRDLPCKINGQVLQNVDLVSGEKIKIIKCLTDEKDVYVPFTFIKKYFDVSSN